MPRLRRDELDDVDELLHRWGDWARSRVGDGIGWNPRTPLGRVIEEGAMVPQVSRTVSVSDIVEAIEGAVVRAPSRIRDVTIVHYCRHAHEPMQVQAKRLGTSRQGLHAEIRVAQAYVLGAIAG
jgi:hypothetical protein